MSEPEYALSPIESRLVEAVPRGRFVDLAGTDPVDEAAMRSWGADRTIRATVLRDIVRGRLAADPDPRGLRLRGARIEGRLDLRNITSKLNVELIACFLPAGVVVRDADLHALDLGDCLIEPPAGAEASTVDATNFTATLVNLAGARVIGEGAPTVQLRDARLGVLGCNGAHLENPTGKVLDADRLTVDQIMSLRAGFTATGRSEVGAVRLIGAHLAQLECAGARLENTAGPALAADYLHVDRNMSLDEGFVAVGHGDLGAVRLSGARLGLLDCTGARLENAAGPALQAEYLHVDQVLFLRNGSATGTGKTALVDLHGAAVGGELWLDFSRITRPDGDQGPLVELNGATYSGIPRPGSLTGWLDLIRDHTRSYAAQPYQQLAAAHRAAGHDREVRTVLMAQRRDQIGRRAITGWDRTWARITGLTLGYGYQPWRALLLLLTALALSIAGAVAAGHSGGLAHTSRSTTPNAVCSTLEQVGVGLDLGTPLLKTGARDQCAPTATGAGQALTAAGWLLQVLAWAFAALFVSGFTGAVRKT